MPAIILVVQIDPGPIPILIPSAPASISASAPSGVATFPAMISLVGNSFLIFFTVSICYFGVEELLN